MLLFCSDDKDSVQGWSDYELLDEPDCVEVKPRYVADILALIDCMSKWVV